MEYKIYAKTTESAYREEPDNNFPNDSGWRFLAGTEDNDYTNSPDNFNVFELNTVCNYDNAILPILESEIGSSYIRKSEEMVLDDIIKENNDKFKGE